MKSVTVSKVELLRAVAANREQHRSAFEIALNGFLAESQRELASLVEKVRNRDVRAAKSPFTTRGIYIDLPLPEDHTADYDRVLRMLAMSVDENIELSGQEFRSYVMDDWDWKEQWSASNSLYTDSFQA